MSTVQEEVSTSKDSEKAALTTDKPDGGGGDVNLKPMANFDNSQNVKQVPSDNSKITTDLTSEKFYQKELVSENVEIMAETVLNEELLLKGDDDDDNEECQAKDLNKIIKTATDNSDQALKNKAVSSDQQTEHLTLLTDENVEEITPMDISKEILPRDDSGKETDDKIVLIENLAEEKTEFKGIYKETLIDDDDDSDFELVYKTDDEMQTDEVLNLLDKELGLTDDSKSTENNGNKFIENSRHDENMIVSDITEQEIENRNGITEMSCDITNNDKIDDSVTKPDEEEEEMILPDLQREADISMNQGTSDLNIKAIISDIKEQEFEIQHDKSDNTNIDKIKENVTKPDEEEEMILPDTERQTGIYMDDTNQDTAYLNIKVLVSDIKQQEIEKQDDKAEMTYDNTTIDKIVENVTKPDEEEEMILPDIERQPDIRINDTNQDKADLNIKEQETAISKNDGDDKNVHESEDVSLELLTGIGKNYENNQNTLETVSAVLVKEINIRQNNGDKTIQNPQETIFSTLSVSDKLELLHTDTSKYDEVDNKAHKVVLSDSSEHVTEMQDDNNDKIVENAGPNFIIPDKEPEFGDKRTELTDIPSKDARIKENMKNKNKIIGTVDAKIILETEMIETKDKEAVPEVSKDLVDWDDDDVMETDIQPLSDDALKRLDEELGITETNTTVTEQFGDAKDIVPKDSKITESSDQKPDSQNVPTEKNVEEVTSMDICEEILPDIVYSKSKEIVEKNPHIENIAETQIDTKVIPDFISMEVNIEKNNLEETSVENKTEDSARMDEDIPKQDDEKVEGKEIHETDKNINLVTEVDITPKIRVLNVAEINYENKMKESIDCDNAEEAPIVNDDGVLNISVERNEIIIDATTVLTEKEFITPDLANDSTSIGIKTDHKINRPDVMIDIPTRELIDFEDDEIMKSDDKRDVYSLTGKTVTEIVSQLAETSTKINTTKDKDQTDSATVEKTDEVVNQKPESPKNTLETAKNQDGDNKKAESEATDLQKIIKTEKDAASNEASKNQVENQPSTSKSTDDTKVTSTDPKTVSEDPKESLECQKMIPDEEAIEDTLDLLAESSIVPDDDEEQEPEVDDDDDDGNGDDDDEIDPDDESNQMTTAEHSEDSNSNTDQAQETDTEQNFLKVTEGVPQSVIGDQSETSLDVVSDSNAEIELVSDSNDANEFNEDVEDVLKKEEKVSEKLEAMLKTTISGVESVSKTRRRSILLELLTKIDDEDGEENSRKIKRTQKQDTNIVDLGESDSEEDVQVKKSKKIDIPSEGDKKLDTSPQDEQSDAKKDEDDVDKAKEKENKEIEAILDSDSDEDLIAEDVPPLRNNICINNNCTSDDSVQYYIADKSCKSYYRVARGRGAVVCQYCMEFVNNRNRNLVSGIKDLRPLIELEMSSPHQQLVEISDSESDEDDGDTENRIGKDTADLLEDQLEEVFNCTWRKYNMDERLRDTEDYLKKELEKLNAQSKDVGELLKNCENETDALRNAFYLEFEPKKHALAALYIHDTPIASYFCPEKDEKAIESCSRYPKRQASTTIETPAKKQAMVKEFASPETDQTKQDDDDKDVSVVHLSAEEAPAHLPPPGEVVRAPLAAGMAVYAMKNSFGAWLRGKLLEVCGKLNGFTQCRIRFEHNIRNTCKVLSARSIAYTEPSDVRLTIGTRVVALFKTEYGDLRKDAYYSGVVAEIPNPVNNYRYLVFFDDGYAQYVPHQHTRLVAESSDHVWEEVHPFSRDFVYNYLLKYPERPMVRMHQGQTISVELNGKWYETRVVKVDASLVQVLFLEENRTEWIYRGSTRLRPLFVEIQAAQGAGSRARLPRSTRNNSKLNNVPYVEYTRSEEQTNKNNVPQQIPPITEEQRRLRAVAKKSTGPAPIPASTPSDGVTSRVVYYTPKHAVRPHKLSPHTCGPRCRRTDLLSLKELRTYNPLAKPLLSGWERQIVRMKAGRREVMYRAPCGRRVRNMSELHRYLSALRSDLSVDLFDFNPSTHCLAEFVLTKYNVGKKDLSHGQENVPVACVNYYDTTLPEFCTYNTERTPTAGVPLNLDPEFLCGCDCTDDCVDKSKCACWQMTLEGARTIGMEGPNIGYQYRRLLEPLPTGIYECNSRCKCKNTCLNRVAQHPLQLKLQVFKTINRGWGIRALNDVPKGAFLCIYAGNLLTDATANLDGLNEGDEYLAELDYIEVVEGMKEGYEEDVVEPDSKSDKKDKSSENEESENEKSEEEDKSNDNEDVDFLPGSIGLGLTEFSKRLRKRNKKKNKEDSTEKDGDNQNKKEGDDCITISDDDEVREPARFTAQEGMKDKKIVPKYASVRDYFGKDEACYIMDAKVQGNIGRYLNHSCSPNVFVQNVFVDTHDPRFPWVSFFALHHIRAGTELTWNYNYDVGSVPGKVLYCFCGAGNCRGRLL